jgi:hypothetical protein
VQPPKWKRSHPAPPPPTHRRPPTMDAYPQRYQIYKQNQIKQRNETYGGWVNWPTAGIRAGPHMRWLTSHPRSTRGGQLLTTQGGSPPTPRPRGAPSGHPNGHGFGESWLWVIFSGASPAPEPLFLAFRMTKSQNG